MLLLKNHYPKRPLALALTPTEIIVTLADGSVVVNRLSWHPWLEQATSEERVRYELGTYDIQWPDLNQCLDIEGMIRGSVPNSFATY